MRRAVVSGATGFLGGALARRLHAEGWQVIGLGRDAARGAALVRDGVQFEPGDLRQQAPDAACAGATLVVHCAARSGPWGRRRDFLADNVTGTERLVGACLRGQVGRLVHISTPSLYFFHDERLAVDETCALPTRPANAYVESKRLAEQVVERAADDGLATITLRPRGLFGPGDTTIFPRLLTAIERGRLPQIGDGEALTDLTYIDSAVDACLCAAAAPAACEGRVYNISNGEPRPLWGLVAQLCEMLALDYPTRQLSARAAFRLAGLLEWTHRWLLFGKEPLLTRYSVGLLCRSQTLDISRARRELGYAPAVDIDEGLRRFVSWWRARAGAR